MKILNLCNEPQWLETLAKWHQRQWSYLNPGQSLQQRMDKMREYLEPKFIPSMYIAKDDDLVGSAAIVASDMETRMQLSPWLASVFIAKKYRGHGYGSLLVSHVMNEAKNNGIESIFLFTPDQENFYRRLGWQTIEKTDYRDCSVFVMRAKLL